MNRSNEINYDGCNPSASRLYRDRRLKLADLVSLDKDMMACLALAQVAAEPQDLGILIVGETGTGKNLLALAIHNESKRRAGPFVAVNTGAVPDSLAGSELFGHEKGAFTGAHGERRGVIQIAHGGTLFLDELGNMSAELQRTILTVVEERSYRRVGGSEELTADVRVIAATNADLREKMNTGGFRQDLYHRVCNVVLRVPPLRDRQADILPFARRFLGEAKERYGVEVEGFTRACEDRMLKYEWPGNVRQLRRAVASAVGLKNVGLVGWEDLAHNLEPRLAGVNGDPGPSGELVPPSTAPMDHVIKWHLVRVLRQVGGNKSEAAKLLGVSRRGLYDMLNRFGLDANGDNIDEEA